MGKIEEKREEDSWRTGNKLLFWYLSVYLSVNLILSSEASRLSIAYHWEILAFFAFLGPFINVAVVAWTCLVFGRSRYSTRGVVLSLLAIALGAYVSVESLLQPIMAI